MGRLIALLLAAPAMAMAQEPMSGADFDAYTQNRTLTFGLPNDAVHGVEQYLPDRRVIWSPAPGECIDGTWYADSNNICFVYENDPEHKCWLVFRTERGIRAEFQNRPGGSILFEAVDDPAPLICDNLLS